MGKNVYARLRQATGNGDAVLMLLLIIHATRGRNAGGAILEDRERWAYRSTAAWGEELGLDRRQAERLLRVLETSNLIFKCMRLVKNSITKATVLHVRPTPLALKIYAEKEPVLSHDSRNPLTSKMSPPLPENTAPWQDCVKPYKDNLDSPRLHLDSSLSGKLSLHASDLTIGESSLVDLTSKGTITFLPPEDGSADPCEGSLTPPAESDDTSKNGQEGPTLGVGQFKTMSEALQAAAAMKLVHKPDSFADLREILEQDFFTRKGSVLTLRKKDWGQLKTFAKLCSPHSPREVLKWVLSNWAFASERIASGIQRPRPTEFQLGYLVEGAERFVGVYLGVTSHAPATAGDATVSATKPKTETAAQKAARLSAAYAAKQASASSEGEDE